MVTFKLPKRIPSGKGIVREVYLDDKYVGDIIRTGAFNYYYQPKKSYQRGPLSPSMAGVQLKLTNQLGEGK